MLIWFLFGFMCALVLLLGLAYLKFISLTKTVRRAWQQLDNNMKNRAELIPSLALFAASFEELDRAFVEEFSRLKDTCRKAPTLQQRVACEADVTQKLKKVFTAANNHTQLNSNEQFLKLQKSVILAEGKVQSAKRKYNSAARDFNTLADVFPLSLIAQVFEFEQVEYFDFDNSIPKN